MKLLLQSAMIFFGTLMAAGLVALGEPASQRTLERDAAGLQAANALVEIARPWIELTSSPRGH